MSDHPFAFEHMVYFVLVDRSPSTVKAFLDACETYLSRHEGQITFSLGIRALDMRRDVNDQAFDVSMYMLFDSQDSYGKYRVHPRHEEFITASAGLSPSRRVFDAYVRRLSDGKRVRVP